MAEGSEEGSMTKTASPPPFTGRTYQRSVVGHMRVRTAAKAHLICALYNHVGMRSEDARYQQLAHWKQCWFGYRVTFEQRVYDA